MAFQKYSSLYSVDVRCAIQGVTPSITERFLVLVNTYLESINTWLILLLAYKHYRVHNSNGLSIQVAHERMLPISRRVYTDGLCIYFNELTEAVQLYISRFLITPPQNV